MSHELSTGESAPHLTTRREMLKAAAAVGVAALAGDVLGQTAPPATKPAPLVGIQIGAKPISEDTDRLLDTLRTVGGINALFIFAYGYEARFVPWTGPFVGGNYSIPHMQYYDGSNLTLADMRAPELPNLDVLDRAMTATRKHGFKTYALIEETESHVANPHWQAFYEVNFHGRPQSGPCSNNPAYRAFAQGLMEDYARSYNVDGFMWSSERQGGLTNAIGARHGGIGTNPANSTCFCQYCTKKGADLGINVDRAKLGFTALETFVRAGRAGKRPRDGYFVSFMRLMLDYPELLQWEALWINSRKQLMIDMRNRVKSASPSTPVGFHVWHNASFSPFYRAEIDFADMAKNADFIKPVVYNSCGGSRMVSFINSVGQTIFGDVPPAQLLQVVYEMFDYKEAPYDKLAAAGFSTDYIAREVKRTIDDVAGANVPVYAGLDIDIPGSTYTAESVKQSVMTAFNAGANGVIFARNWGEMNPDHVAGVGAAVKELGFN
ncbi:MAG: hypothetical protein ABSH22_17770 [Tepidisphaeraceae bacterium]|jgi:hypothetical protein